MLAHVRAPREHLCTQHSMCANARRTRVPKPARAQRAHLLTGRRPNFCTLCTFLVAAAAACFIRCLVLILAATLASTIAAFSLAHPDPRRIVGSIIVAARVTPFLLALLTLRLVLVRFCIWMNRWCSHDGGPHHYAWTVNRAAYLAAAFLPAGA
jgi:hypothetical protein